MPDSSPHSELQEVARRVVDRPHTTESVELTLSEGVLDLYEQLEAERSARFEVEVAAALFDEEHQKLKEQLEALRSEAQKFAGSVIWLDNNLHNYGSEGWRDFFKASLRDARRLYALTEIGGDVGRRPSPSETSNPAKRPT